MKHAVVTGANGFIGTWLIKELIKEGVKVTAVVRNPDSDLSGIQEIPGTEIIYCSMENIEELPAMLGKQEYDVFYHLAWAGSTGKERAEYDMQLQNVKWTCSAVRAAGKIGCRRFVGTGTLAEMDVQSYIPLDGTLPNAVSNYGTAKIAAHFMSKAESCASHVEHLWAYLPNTYGTGNRTSNFVNFASKTMLLGEPADFTSGEQLYDFVYVSDVVHALYLIGEKGSAMSSYYIGSTKPVPLKEYIVKIRDAVNPEIELHLGAVPFHGTELKAEMFDCSKLVKDTGYEPRVAFEDGIAETVHWLKQEMGVHDADI